MSTNPSTPENDANLSGLGRALLETGSSKPSSGPWIPPTADELGKLLPEYDIVKMLGRGGMGAVYMGRQKSLDRAVAIKILSGTLEDSDMGFKERFKNEARAMGKLNFAGIVAVHDFGEAKGGLLYIVMEYVEGTDVSRMIAKEGRLHTEHAMAITAHVCDALQYAHERGIIHRDIKPANIMVGYDGVVKVADFGLAKMTHSNATGLTQSGMTMGTLHYMAPECLMLGAAVDHRADIYAVGVILYQMLTGKLPQGAFELPSLQIAGLDPRYDQIIAKALREDREVRYQNIRDMRCDLDAILTQPVAKVEPEVSHMPAALPTQARPQRPGAKPYRPPQSVVQHQHAPKSGGSWGWAAVLSIAVLGAGGWWLTQHRGGDLQSPGTPPGSSPSIPAPAVVNTPPQVVPPTVKPASPPVKVTTTPAPPALSTPAMPVPPPTSAFDLQQLPDFRTRVANYQKARHAQLAELTTKYLSALTAEKDAAIQSGVLASVTACDAAIANAATFAEVINQNLTATAVKPLPALAAVADPDPPRLKELRDIFLREVEKIENTLIASLDQSFATVQATLVQADKLTDAKAVEDYRKNMLAVFKTDHSASASNAAAAPPTTGTTTNPAEATKDRPFVNSLGMKFVPVPGTKVLMCIHETRRQDYAAYANEHSSSDQSWKVPTGAGRTLEVSDAHPVCFSGFDDAASFCQWLSRREGATFRLPTLEEWDQALRMGWNSPPTGDDASLFYWGTTEMPPPDNTANLPDAANKAWDPRSRILNGYSDGFATAGPAMSYAPNNIGVYDLIGNVWEICTDAPGFSGTRIYLRGGAWNCWNIEHLRPSVVLPASRTSGRNSYCGFRIVVELPSASANAEAQTPAFRQTVPSAGFDGSTASLPSSATKDRPFVNSLGMKFVPVPGTKVLMCIHETRYKDYMAYAEENPGISEGWKNQVWDGFVITDRPEEHPVVNLTWLEAQRFGEWLSKKESLTYRLPADQEWSLALGFGDEADWGKKKQNPVEIYPWGEGWPPPPGAGNYCDQSQRLKAPEAGAFYIDGYDDGFPTTAPVMSFPPNALGLYDMGGNAWECVLEGSARNSRSRFWRGAGWKANKPNGMLASHRGNSTPNYKNEMTGFRVVLELP